MTMLKSFHLTTAFLAASILFIAETALTLPLTASSKYPVVPSSDTDKLICYMQTVDGRTLNLDSLCTKQVDTQVKIVISDVRYEGERMVGHVVNKTGKTAYFVKVNYEVLDANGSVIGRLSTDTDTQRLSPGESATFQTPMPGGGDLRMTSIEWND